MGLQPNLPAMATIDVLLVPTATTVLGAGLPKLNVPPSHLCAHCQPLPPPCPSVEESLISLHSEEPGSFSSACGIKASIEHR